MNLKAIVIAAAMCGAGPVMAATCQSLRTPPPGNEVEFFDFFDTVGTFDDCYSFTLAQATTSATIITQELDTSAALDIGPLFVSMFGANFAGVTTGPFRSQLSWTFTDLAAGPHMFSVSGNVSGRRTIGPDVGYVGYLSLGAVSPVPEPQTLAMFALGLVAVVWGGRRKA